MKRLLLLLLLLIPAKAFATTYYVAKDCSGGSTPPLCSDSNNGTTRQTAEVTIAAGVAHLAAGDTLEIGAGTYTGTYNGGTFIDSGIQQVASGSSNLVRTTIKAEAGAEGLVIIAPASGDSAAMIINGQHDVTLGPGLVLDGSNVSFYSLRLGYGATPSPYRIRIIGNILRYGKADGVLAGTGKNSPAVDGGDEFINNEFYGCCSVDFSPPGHTIYFGGNNSTFDGNYIHDNGSVVAASAGGFQFYDNGEAISNNIIRNNVITREGQACLQLSGGGGTGNVIYNNIIMNCRDSPRGVNTSQGMEITAATTATIYNNVFYNNRTYGLACSNSSVVTARNNIMYLNDGTQPVHSFSCGSITQSNNVTTDPGFLGAASGDFHLTADIGAGFDTSATVTADKDGLATTAPMDIGAYRYPGRIGAHASAASSDGNPPTTSAITTTSAKVLILQINSDISCSPTPSDSKNNTWSLINSVSAVSGVKVALWIASGSGIIVGSGHTFTTSAGLCYSSIYALAINSDSTTSGTTVDTSVTNSTTATTTIQAGNLVTTINNEIILSAFGMAIDPGAVTSIDSGFTIAENRPQGPLSYGGALAYKVEATFPMGRNPTWTYAGSGTSAVVNASLLDRTPFCTGASPNWTATTWADVPICHDAAIAGDTITVGAGTFDATSQTTITKAITLAGTGTSTMGSPGLTIVRNATTSGGIVLQASAGARITGFTFSNNGGFDGNPNGTINLFGAAIRFDHNTLDHPPKWGIVTFDVTGVFDHNIFLFDNGSTKNPLYLYNGGATNYGDESWGAVVDWSGSDWLFVETNTFIDDIADGPCSDGVRGMRAVFRYNTVTGCSFQNHGTESFGRPRSGLAMQVYRNTITGTGTTDEFAGIRGGSALVWGNTSALSTTVAAKLHYHRSEFDVFFWEFANGESPWDVNDVGNPQPAGAACNPSTTHICTATDGGSLSVTVAGAGWSTDQFFGYTIHKQGCAPTGAVCSANILSNTGTVLTMATGFGGGAISFSAGETFVINKITRAIDQPGVLGGTALVSSAYSNGAANGTIVTITTFGAHGLTTGRYVGIQSNASGTQSGTFQITVTGTTTFTYLCSGCTGSGGGDYTPVPVGWNDQAVAPIYEWLNVNSSGSTHTQNQANCVFGCVTNSTYYNYVGSVQTSSTSPFSGATGVGVGPFATRPGTCTSGVAFWATDEGEWDSTNGATADGKMYICVASAWVARYGAGTTGTSGTPFTYPHPLTNAGTATSTQYAFRFVNDNGSESAATFAAAENANYSIAADTVTRIRIGVDTTSTLGPQTFQLESKLSTDSTYAAVPTSTPTQQTVVLTASQSWTVPANVVTIQAECVGGGGAGGRSVTAAHGGGGGKGGTYTVETAYTVTPGASLTATIGAGGTSGVTPVNGSQTSLTVGASTICSAAGGDSVTSDSATGATTTTGTNVGDTTTAGTSGSSGSGASSGAGGAGGVPLGGAGGTSVGAGNTGINGSAPGGGGSGGSSSVSTQQVTLTNASPNWTAPAGVTTVTSAACRGPGANGAGDSSTAPQGATGGGGGAYAVRANIGVTAGNNYNATIPAGGSQSATSWTGNAALGCSAAGATNPANDAASSAGASTGTGDTIRSGGNGGTVAGGVSTGGGEGGCSTGNGNSSTGSAGGTGCDGGNGGAASTGNSNGSAGVNPGGGGGGGRRTSGGTKTGGAGAAGNVLLTFDQGNAFNGGAGAAGQVKITYTATPPIVYAASTNIAAGGNTATTTRLTAPTGKTSAVFTGGKISDDTNPFPSVTIQTGGYSEFEAAFKVIGANSVVGNAYDFRLTKAGTAMDTYTNVPRVTLTSGSSVAPETAANGSGVTIIAQNVEGGALGTVTAYCIQRDSSLVFVANVACTWSLTSKTVGVVDGDLVPAGDFKSAVFTGHALGTGIIHVDFSGPTGNSGLLTVIDTTVPAVGAAGVITTSGITQSNITLNWTKATDLVWAQNTLQYEVRRSSSNNINSIANAEANGVVQGAYTADIATFNVTGPGIVCNTLFYFAIIVKDGSGNKGFYPSISETTSACPTAQPHAGRRRVH